MKSKAPKNKPLQDELDATWKHPEALRQASEEVTEAIDLAWVAARTVFGKQAKPQHAIDMARLFIEQARQQKAPPALARPEGLPRLNAAEDDGRDLSDPLPKRSKRTAVDDPPPRAVSKAGRPARM